jgi:predicted ABC-type ATPase
MAQNIILNGRPAVVFYCDAGFVEAPRDQAVFAQVFFDDGDAALYRAETVANSTIKQDANVHVYRLGWCITCATPRYDCANDFDESKHPRDDHGRFAESDSGGDVEPNVRVYADRHHITREQFEKARTYILSNATTDAERTHANKLAVAHVHAEQLLERGDTKSSHTRPDGRYTEERLRLHEKIFDQFWADHADRYGALPPQGVAEPVVTMMAGMPGAGKSTAVADIGDELRSQFVKIDPDEMKKYIPEYEGGAGAAAVQRESGDLADRLMEIAVARRMNIMIDGTMKTSGTPIPKFSDGALGKMAQFKQEGYRVEMRFVDVTVNQSITRVVNRFASDFDKTGSGRYVPVSFTHSLADTNYGTRPRANFELAKETSINGKPLVDAWRHVDGWTGKLIDEKGNFKVAGK